MKNKNNALLYPNKVNNKNQIPLDSKQLKLSHCNTPNRFLLQNIFYNVANFAA
ncbi:MAG: hypothetical protein SPJ16_05380 [Helicobacter sp.]|nr:hypothetical protein [Helicobacter sp.]